MTWKLLSIIGLGLILIFTAPIGASAQCPATQTTPNITSGGNVFGFTGPQWEAFFGAKVDATGGCSTNQMLVNPTITGGAQWAIYNEYYSSASGGGCPITITVVTTGPGANSTANYYAVIFNPSGTISSCTITLPATPFDKEPIMIETTQNITTLTISSINTVVGNVTSLTPSGAQGVAIVRWRYYTACTCWFPN